MKNQLVPFLVLFFLNHIFAQDIIFGGLFPLTGVLGIFGPIYEAAARVAIQNINSNPEILPNYNLSMVTIDTGSSSLIAFPRTLDFFQTTNASQLAGIIGAGFSSVSQTTQLLCSTFQVPQISYASTDSTLSDITAFPTFARVVPSDDLQTQVLVQLVAHFGWTAVATITTSDSIESQVFITGAEASAIQILSTQTFQRGTTNVTDQVRRLAESGARIFIMFALPQDARVVLQEAIRQGIVGPGYVWIGNDGVSQDDLFIEMGITNQQLLGDFRGALGIRPRGARGPLFETFLDQWQNLDPALFPGAGVRDITIFGPYAYDAVFAMARSLHNLLEVSQEPLNGTRLLEFIRTLQFEGLTGSISFNNVLDRVGAYEIVNLRGENRYEVIGEWEGAIVLSQDPIFADGTTEVPPATFCSDGVIVSPEECEDGNRRDGDGCNSMCQIESGINAGALAAAILVPIIVCCLLITVVIVVATLYLKKAKTPRGSMVDFELSSAVPVLENIKVQEVIGRGEFGQVHKGLWNSNPVALKTLNSSQDINHELNLMIDLRHPNILTLL